MKNGTEKITHRMVNRVCPLFRTVFYSFSSIWHFVLLIHEFYFNETCSCTLYVYTSHRMISCIEISFPPLYFIYSLILFSSALSFTLSRHYNSIIKPKKKILRHISFCFIYKAMRPIFIHFFLAASFLCTFVISTPFRRDSLIF